jgi:CubicO group peptidase (beta-lactamase class C family)
MNNAKQFDKKNQNSYYQLKQRLIMILGSLFISFCSTGITGYAKTQVPVILNPQKQVAWDLTYTDSYQYGIGSVSKMFGAVAVMKLVEEGKIDLDTPLTYYIPEFRMADERYKQITPKMLLNHSSGIMGTTLHNSFLHGDSDTSYHDTFLDQLAKQELKAAPGDYSVYCNDGFTLAEILVEQVSGMSFSEFIQKEISEPLGLSNTTTPRDKLDENLLAPIYFGSHQIPYTNCNPLASGGIYGTSKDLVKFSTIFMKDHAINILSKESLDLMSKPWYLEDKIAVTLGDTQMGYGLGWDSVNAYPFNLYGIKALTKGGDVNGYHANLTVLPEQNLSIALTSSGGSSTYLLEAAQDIVLEVLLQEGLISDIKDTTIKAEYEAELAPLPKEMKQYEGYYLSLNMIKIEFNEEGTLLLTPIGTEFDTVQEYVYTKSGEFVSTKGYYLSNTGAFVSNADGNTGFTKFTFRKETNGKTYLIGSTYESTNGLGETALTMPFAEKIEPHTVSMAVLDKWKTRADKKYYLINEAYNSRAYLENPAISFQLVDEVPGYVTRYTNKSSNEKCRILDENTAKSELDLPIMLGRDLFHYAFYEKDKIEYVTVETYNYAGEETVKSSKKLTNSVIIEEDLAVWYEIAEEDTAALIEITTPDHGAYYVYDKDNNCIASSLYKGQSDSFMLPTRGHIVFAGNKGAVFQIKR